MRLLRTALTWGVFCAALAGCASAAAPPVASTSCLPFGAGRAATSSVVLRLHFDGELYRPVSGLQRLRRGPALGRAQFVDCDGTLAPEFGERTMYRIVGEDPKVVTIVGDADGDSVYINVNHPYRERPQLIKDSQGFLPCHGPAHFTGTWNYVDGEDMPNGEDYDSARVPYTAVFTSSDGTGLQLDRWDRVMLEAEVTSRTQPVPTPRFLKRATGPSQEPVTVTTVCHGDDFEVTAIELAGLS